VHSSTLKPASVANATLIPTAQAAEHSSNKIATTIRPTRQLKLRVLRGNFNSLLMDQITGCLLYIDTKKAGLFSAILRKTGLSRQTWILADVCLEGRNVPALNS
jgi:hypothetical protein